VVQDSVLTVVDSLENLPHDLAVYAVWEPIFRTDNERAARKATILLPSKRVKHYWVGSQDLGKTFTAPIGLASGVAWDVYLVYLPGRVWEESGPPVPDDFMHQLGDRLPEEKGLDGGKLRRILAASANSDR
jgi:hypothetical protein